MKQIRRQTIKSVFVVSAVVAAITGCSNQVETTGNTIPTTVPASTGNVCCTPQNNANTNAYNVLGNTSTTATPNTNTPAAVYTPPATTQPATIPAAQAVPQQPASNVSYYDYGASNTADTSYNYSNTSTTVASSTQPTSNDMRPAVQVLASGAYATAQGMQQQMRASGYEAIIVQAGGLYKVRIPYGSYEEAKGRLSQIRTTVPDAFVSR